MSTTTTKLSEVFDKDLETSGAQFVTSWTSDGSGNYTENIVFRGFLTKIKFIPGAGGSQPTAGYAVKLLDSDGDDVLKKGDGTALGNSLSNTASVVYPDPNSGVSLVCYLNGTYTLSVSGAGITKSGTVAFTIKNR